MLRNIIAWVATAVAFAGIDFIWLTNAQGLYRPALDEVLSPTVNFGAAIAFYLIYITGMTVMAVLPAGSLRAAAGKGAMLGCFAYATYDLTNQATLKVWYTHITVADIAWGTFLTASAAAIGWLVASRIPSR
ncbi:MAG TPA: DUF2177 family protein [Phenylobacterium sp.]|uniref:DUF2177 family protein n=1 Tax=Phenylobacterium sp. TaxID=1871053 RepID=UPI002BA7A53C|nr:DUF2177 family protein [Phenylobacterium sp.]